MPSYELNDEEIAMLCDIAGRSVVKTNPRKKIELARLVADGMIEVVPQSAAETGYKITAKGQSILDEHGVGANEA